MSEIDLRVNFVALAIEFKRSGRTRWVERHQTYIHSWVYDNCQKRNSVCHPQRTLRVKK